MSLTNEATGTISSVDGTGNVSGSVTLLNSAVTAKVLTGLPTPSAGNIQASDTILQAFGKLQSQVSSISNGLIFKGSWDAATNTPTLTSGGGEVDQGTTTGQAANKLIDTSQNFNVTVSIGDKVINQVDGQSALVTVIDSNTQLSLDADIMLSSEAYTIDASPFIQQGQYYVVNYAGTTNLNGITDWSIGDWVIADADNRWSKLDHSQVDGQGSIGNLSVWTTANTLGDSIVSESGTALTVTGSLDTTLGASVTGDFAINTDKFTVNATSGNTTIAGDVSLPDSKKAIFGTGNDLEIYHDGASSYIKDVGTGSLNILGSGSVRIKGSTTDEFMGRFNENGSVQLYYNNVEKLATTSTGILVSGTSSTFAGDVKIAEATNKGQLFFGTANTDYEIKGGGNYGYLSLNAPILRFDTGGTERMRIDSLGNSTFSGDVSISNTSGATLNINTNQAGQDSKILLHEGTTASPQNGASIRYDGNTNLFKIGVGTNVDTTRLTIARDTGNATFAGSVGKEVRL